VNNILDLFSTLTSMSVSRSSVIATRSRARGTISYSRAWHSSASRGNASRCHTHYYEASASRTTIR